MESSEHSTVLIWEGYILRLKHFDEIPCGLRETYNIEEWMSRRPILVLSTDPPEDEDIQVCFVRCPAIQLGQKLTAY